MQVITKVYENFSDTRDFIDKLLNKACYKDKMSVEEVVFYH